MTGTRFVVDSVTVDFGSVQALVDVSLDIAAGEAVAFVGPSGAGKSTLLRLLNGSVRPTSGTVAVDGEVLAGLGPRELRAVRAAIGFIHQDLSLVPNLRVSQNIGAGRVGRLSFPSSLRMAFYPPRTAVREMYAILERVGIPEKLFERTDRLSGGQRQRVAIARALFQDAGALLADEPVSSVDPARARDTVELLAGISAEEQITLCISLHNLDLAREYFKRLVGLRNGRVMFDRPSAAVGPEEFAALYDLRPEEMLADGA